MFNFLIFFVLMFTGISGVYAKDPAQLVDATKQMQENRTIAKQKERDLHEKITLARKNHDKELAEQLHGQWLQLRRENRAQLRENRQDVKEARRALREDHRQEKKLTKGK